MANPSTGIDHEFTKMMMDALSLPKHTRSFELRVAVNEVVSVKCEYFPEIETGKLETIFIKYDLVKKPEIVDATTLESKAITHIVKDLPQCIVCGTLKSEEYCKGCQAK